MPPRYILFALVVLLAAGQGFHQWRLRPVHPADGVLAPDEPLQELADPLPLDAIGRWRLIIRARYDITARVLGRESYQFDALASLAPEDLALGWGAMSDNVLLRRIRITQGNRFFYWRESGNDIPPGVIISHSANTHVIPANAGVRRELARVRIGQVVRLRGYLVDVTRDDGVFIRTSLVRTDTGPGACEVMYVELAEVE